ncbi:hypothetical protein E3N88_04697 [Mikania micrantha]|uniref:HMA domain-containing protein n=1 Tax=Mikania micrantha TaxID=192012 RepID=A0A5N6PV60_9ASTR|nr:hypothetical protein E3N88_04697 [Mikania micrantha]
MAPEKVTEMILNVDLKCSGCYKKVKKVICKIPQITDQVFDVDKNKVKIKVVCCSPEKIRDKLCYKGEGAIQSIEIIEKPTEQTDKPNEPKMAKPVDDKPKVPKKVTLVDSKPNDPEMAKPVGDKPKPKVSQEPEKVKPTDPEKPKEANKPNPPKDEPMKPDSGPNPDAAKMVYEPVHGYPQMHPLSAYPMAGYGWYNDNYYGGVPFQHGYGTPVAPPPPAGYGGFGYGYDYNGYNGNRGRYAINDYEDEDDGGCSIM